MAGPLQPVPDPEPGPQGNTVPGDPAPPGEEVLAERRARRAELAEQELRGRLADSDRRVAELELAAQESARAEAELKARRGRDAELAELVGEAADAVAYARRAVDGEIHARQAAEAALAAERVARLAAEQAVAAERAARDAAFEAMVAERVRELPGQGAGVAASPPAVDPSLRTTDSRPDSELAAGIAAAAERLRASVPPPGSGERPEPASPAGSGGSAPGRGRSGGVVGWLEGMLQRRR